MTSRQILQGPAFHNAVIAVNAIPASALIEHVQIAEGIRLPNNSIAYRVKKTVGWRVKSLGFSAYNHFLIALLLITPDPSQIFKRISRVGFESCCSMWNSCSQCAIQQQILDIDCGHSKHRIYDGQKMLRVGRYGLQQHPNRSSSHQHGRQRQLYMVRRMLERGGS